MTNDCSDGVSPDSSNNPELICFLPLDNEFDFACLEGFERPESRQHQALEDLFVFPLVTVHKNDVYPSCEGVR